MARTQLSFLSLKFCLNKIEGNLPLGAVCCLCNEDCSMEPGLIDYQCCWCQRTVHTSCLSKLPQDCDFGPFRNMIVPPWCVQVARRKGALNKHLLLRGVKDPGWKNWTPLVVVANKKSGNNDGAVVLSEFRKYLNPVQVVDLSSRKPAAALQWAVLLAPKEVWMLVGGGDGTVAWMLTASHKLDLDVSYGRGRCARHDGVVAAGAATSDRATRNRKRLKSGLGLGEGEPAGFGRGGDLKEHAGGAGGAAGQVSSSWFRLYERNVG